MNYIINQGRDLKFFKIVVLYLIKKIMNIYAAHQPMVILIYGIYIIKIYLKLFISKEVFLCI